MSDISDKIVRIRKPKPKFRILDSIANRWSPRYFAPDKVTRKDLDAMFEAARWAPSGHNHQPWQYYFTQKNTDAYRKLFSTLNEYNQSWARTAPILVLACAITKIDGENNRFAHYDLGASVMSFVLQAQELGYHARQMGLFDKTGVKEFFRLKTEQDPYTIIALGKIGNYAEAPQKLIEMELDPRPRKLEIATELQG